MTLGTGTYPNGAKFSFPRSYIPTFNVRVNTPVTDLGTGEFTFPDGSVPGRHYHIVIFEKFYPWSSNKYTMDFVIEQSYYVTDPSPTETPMPFTLIFAPTSDGVNGLFFFPFGAPFTDNNIFLLPPAPPDYWTPVPT